MIKEKGVYPVYDVLQTLLDDILEIINYFLPDCCRKLMYEDNGSDFRVSGILIVCGVIPQSRCIGIGRYPFYKW